jgi:RNA polymerase sigma-70 factor (sigma-E family)
VAERDSFEEYVRARQTLLLRTAYLLTGSHHDAEDLVQLALMKVVPKWGRIKDDPDAYVRRVLVNENISRWRGRRWREVSHAEVPDAAAVEGEDHSDLRAALQNLAPRQRAVIVLRYFEDLTEAQTAEALGISVGTVKSQARDALTRLRTRLPGLDAVGSA